MLAATPKHRVLELGRFTAGHGRGKTKAMVSKADDIEQFQKYAENIQESPHEHQQTQLLSRIITNVVRYRMRLSFLPGLADLWLQEKLNEAVMVLNKSLQVRSASSPIGARPKASLPAHVLRWHQYLSDL